MLTHCKFIFIPTISLMLLLLSCNQNPQTHVAENDHGQTVANTSFDESSLIKVGEGASVDGDLSATLYASDSLYDTYQSFFIKLNDAKGRPIEKARLQILPEMKMGMMAHGAPVIQPNEETENGFFKGAVVFIMPSSSESGHRWTLSLLVDQPDANQNRVSIPVEVKQLKKPRTIAFDGGADGRFFLSWLNSDSVKVGKQPAHFILHRISKNEYPAVFDGYEIQLKTHMPDMGHGSEGNQDAKATGNGYYKGEINLGMPGLWEVQASLLKDGKVVSTEPIVFKVNISE